MTIAPHRFFWPILLALALLAGRDSQGRGGDLKLDGPVSASACPTTSPITVTVYGAAGRVSGSMSVLRAGPSRWMIDCGAFYPEENDCRPDREEQAARQSTELPVEPAAIQGLILTHAHLDHIGRVPLLVARGFQGPIYLSEATAELAEPMLQMQVHFDEARVRTWVWSKSSREKSAESGRSLYVHWQHCPFRQAMSDGNQETAVCSSKELASRFATTERPVRPYLCPSCAKEEVAAIRRLFHPLAYGQAKQIAPGVLLTLLDAGHIPGSASVLVDVTTPTGKRRLLFSGDLGNDLSALFAGPTPGPDADAVFVETTYGVTRRAAELRAERAAFRQAVAAVVRAEGVVWIPAFALDRTQKILYELHIAQRDGLLPTRLPIYCPSPTALTITELYRQHQRDGWFRREAAEDSLAWQPNEIRKTVPSHLPRPSILISPSNMTTAAWSERQLANLLPQPSTAVFLVGYQDPFGEGGLLERGRVQLTVRGQTLPVRAQVRSFHGFSGHGDAADIDRWLSRVHRGATIVLVHGGPEALQNRSEQLKAHGWSRVLVARPNEAIPVP
jgi:metallo-beta-lactamase family protein